MTDKYEEFKKWFAGRGFCVTKLNTIKCESAYGHGTDSELSFTALPSRDLFDSFEREYRDTELMNILENLAEQTDDRNYICTDDIRDAHQKIKDLINIFVLDILI